MKRVKKNRGITLIALAVTIVVILILAAVTIDVTLGQNGILEKSKEAANRMNNLVKEDEAELNELLNELNETMNSNWNSNIEIPDPEPDGESIRELVDDGTIKIGDYVAYTPTGEASYSVDGTYSGTGSDQIINKESLNWRVLDKTEDGKVRLISATSTESTVKLQGANGYNNAVYLLDELCNTLYKGENASAKSLKIEDIQNKMNLNYWDYHNYSNYGVTINPSSKKYPLIFAEEKDQIVDGNSGSLDLSEQTIIMTETKTASSWTVKYTYWANSMGASNYIEPLYHELFHTAATGTPYWLYSRCVYASSDYAGFYVRYINTNNVHTSGLYHSNGSQSYDTCHIRPVVSLESNVEIDTSVDGKDGSSPDKAWIIK